MLLHLGWPLVAQSANIPVSPRIRNEQLDAVRTAWPTLSAKERVVLAGVLGGRSYRQLAADLFCTVKGIDCALRRARRKLAGEDAFAA
jgi:DNA-binding CsgD family transcriptional regulator